MNWNPAKHKGTNVPPPSMLLHAPKRVNCPNCGAPVRPGSARCEYCGSWFDVPDTAQIVFYADNEPVMIVKKISDQVLEDIKRQEWTIRGYLK